jgi:hypothetical protein
LRKKKKTGAKEEEKLEREEGDEHYSRQRLSLEF